jgi:LPXTG-motif cell wall-anchored protein
MRLKIPADAAAGSRASAVGSWFTPSDFQELVGLDDLELGPKGTGPAAGLEAVPAKAAARAAAGQVDTHPQNNILLSEFVVGGGVHPDLAAVGASLTGQPGDKVKARVGFVNHGPGTLYHWTFDNTDPGTIVTVPAGADVVQVDDHCFPIGFPAGVDPEDIDEDFLGATDFLCLLDEGKTAAKASSLFDFTFQVREDAAQDGSVEINDHTDPDAALDRNAANDSAKITLTVPTDGGGGGLPVTGANAGLIGAGGAALLLAGVVGLLLVRRRRVRFTA